jgi:hypothetical protein
VVDSFSCSSAGQDRFLPVEGPLIGRFVLRLGDSVKGQDNATKTANGWPSCANDTAEVALRIRQELRKSARRNNIAAASRTEDHVGTAFFSFSHQTRSASNGKSRSCIAHLLDSTANKKMSLTSFFCQNDRNVFDVHSFSVPTP